MSVSVTTFAVQRPDRGAHTSLFALNSPRLRAPLLHPRPRLLRRLGRSNPTQGKTSAPVAGGLQPVRLARILGCDANADPAIRVGHGRIVVHMSVVEHVVEGLEPVIPDLQVPVIELRGRFEFDHEDLGTEIPVTYVPARNTIFLSLALGWAEMISSSDIFIGVNALDYSGYPDCRPEYIESFERTANLATKIVGSKGI